MTVKTLFKDSILFRIKALGTQSLSVLNALKGTLKESKVYLENDQV